METTETTQPSLDGLGVSDAFGVSDDFVIVPDPAAGPEATINERWYRLYSHSKAMCELMVAFNSELEPGYAPQGLGVAVHDQLSKLENLATAARILITPAIAATGEWKRDGAPNPERWFAGRTGKSPAKARAEMETGKNLENAPGTRKAFLEGEISAEQADTISDVADVNPEAEQALLDAAKEQSLKELKDEAARRKAEVEDMEQREQRIHKKRYVRTWTDREGAWNLHAKGTIPDGADFMSVLERLIDQQFKQARKNGVRGTRDNYCFDALMNMGTQHGHGNPGPTDFGPTGPGPDDRGPKDPGPKNPGPADPGSSNTGPANPGPTKPGTAGPCPTNTGPADPCPTKRGPTVPGPTNPGPSRPGAAGPDPKGPGHTNSGPNGGGRTAPGPNPGSTAPGARPAPVPASASKKSNAAETQPESGVPGPSSSFHDNGNNNGRGRRSGDTCKPDSDTEREGDRKPGDRRNPSPRNTGAGGSSRGGSGLRPGGMGGGGSTLGGSGSDDDMSTGGESRPKPTGQGPTGPSPGQRPSPSQRRSRTQRIGTADVMPDDGTASDSSSSNASTQTGLPFENLHTGVEEPDGVEGRDESQKTTAPASAGPTRRPRPPISQNQIFCIDWNALVRGRAFAGERCELRGTGPVSVASVRRALAVSAAKLVVTDDGGRVVTVAHLGTGSINLRLVPGMVDPTQNISTPPGTSSGLAQSKVVIIGIRGTDLADLSRSEGDDSRHTIHVAGVGNVSSDRARSLLGTGATERLAARATAVHSLTHTGRAPNAAQRIALAWLDTTCKVTGCPNQRIEIDHRNPWATDKVTELDNLDPLCAHHHELKTNHGWQFIHLASNSFVPPDHADHPSAVKRQGSTG